MGLDEIDDFIQDDFDSFSESEETDEDLYYSLGGNGKDPIRMSEDVYLYPDGSWREE